MAKRSTSAVPSMPGKTDRRASDPENPVLDLQNSIGNQAVQRLLVETPGDMNESGESTPSSVDLSLPGSPQPLEPALLQEMEERFGQDFSEVRVHADSAASRSAADVSANAYTVGQDIVFGEDRFEPGTQKGRRLIAHELAHVVQQRRGGSQRGSLDGTGPLERSADQAAAQASSGARGVAVAGAAAPGIMCEPDDEKRKSGGRRPEDEGGTSPRKAEKERTQQRTQERAAAGKQETQLTQAEAERELSALERSYRQPGASSRSPQHKTADLKRFQKLLTLAGGSQLEKNKRQGAFDELQRTPTKTAGAPQTKHVAGGPQLPTQDLRPGEDPYAQPDYSIYRRGKDGSAVRLHVNLKSDKIDTETPSQARGTAKAYRAQAIRNSTQLADGESIIISFARTPSKEVQDAMLPELFAKGSPISEVRFGTTTHRRADYKLPPMGTVTATSKTVREQKQSTPKVTTSKGRSNLGTPQYSAEPDPPKAKPTSVTATSKTIRTQKPSNPKVTVSKGPSNLGKPEYSAEPDAPAAKSPKAAAPAKTAPAQTPAAPKVAQSKVPSNRRTPVTSAERETPVAKTPTAKTPTANIRNEPPGVLGAPAGALISISALGMAAALTALKLWATLRLQRDNEKKMAADQAIIEKLVGDRIAAQTNNIADRWIDFEPVYANVSTQVMIEWIMHYTANVNPQTGVMSGPPEEYARYINASLSGVVISDRPDTKSSTVKLFGTGINQGSSTTTTMEYNTVPIELPVDRDIVRARLSERIDQIDEELKLPAISTMELELERQRLKRLLDLYAY